MFYQNSAAFPPQQSINIGMLNIPLSDINFVENFVNITTATTTDLYTVPAGKKALIPASYFTNVGAAGNATSVAVKISGTYYVLTTSANISANATGTRNSQYIFEAGEILAVITSSTSQLNGRAFIMEIPDYYPIFSAKLTAFTGSGTADILYTLPANKKAFILSPSFPYTAGQGAGLVGGLYTNNSSSDNAILAYVVLPAGSPGTNNNTFPSLTVFQQDIQVFNFCSSLVTAGTTLQISSTASGSGQLAIQNIIELDAQE